MYNSMESQNIALHYILDCALDDIENENKEYYLEDEERELVFDYVRDNDCDIINELISTMREQIIDTIEDIIENRMKVFEVEIIKTVRRVLYIKAHSENDIRNELYYGDNPDIKFEIEQNGEEETEFCVLKECDKNENYDIDLT